MLISHLFLQELTVAHVATKHHPNIAVMQCEDDLLLHLDGPKGAARKLSELAPIHRRSLNFERY